MEICKNLQTFHFYVLPKNTRFFPFAHPIARTKSQGNKIYLQTSFPNQIYLGHSYLIFIQPICLGIASKRLLLMTDYCRGQGRGCGDTFQGGGRRLLGSGLHRSQVKSLEKRFECSIALYTVLILRVFIIII